MFMPILAGTDAAARILTQLSDDSLVQALTDAARLVHRVAWKCPPPIPEGDSSPAVGVEKRSARPKGTSKKPSATVVIITCSKQAHNGISYGSLILSHVASAAMAIVRGTLLPAHVAGLPRVLASLQRTQLLDDLCGAMLRAPTLPAAEPGADELEPIIVCYVNSLGVLCQILYELCKRAYGGSGAPISAAVARVLAAPEVQRLLLAATMRAAELFESDYNADSATGGAGAEAAGLPAGRNGASSSNSVCSQLPSASLGPCGGWLLFEQPFVERFSRKAAREEMPGRWELVRCAVSTWVSFELCGQPGAPPADVLVPLMVRLARALVRTPPARQQPGAYDYGLARVVEIAPMFVNLLIPTVAPGWAMELVTAMYEVLAWGLSAIAHGLAASAGPPDEWAVLASLLDRLSGLLQHPSHGWAALSRDQRDALAQRLAGAQLLRTLDTLLRVSAVTGDPALSSQVVGPVLRIAETLTVPLLCESMRPHHPAAGASSLRVLPPPVPVTDPWDGPHDLGWLVTAAKLVSGHGQVASLGGGGGPCPALSTACFRALRSALQSVALGPAGLPVLLSELSAPGAGPDGNNAGPKAEAMLEALALTARALFASSHQVCSADGPGLGASSSVSAAALLQSAAANVTCLRSAARLLPADALLGAGPLLPLGSTAMVLRDLAAKGGGTAPESVTTTARRLAQSVITALVELAAEPILEPHVRAALAAGNQPSSMTASKLGTVVLTWLPSLPGAPAAFGAGEVAAAVAVFSPRSAKQLARLRAAAEEGLATAAAGAEESGSNSAGGTAEGSAGAAVGLRSPLLAAARELLQAAVDPAADPAVAALEQMDRRWLALLRPGCRLCPPAALRVCGNPACANLTGKCEAALKLRLCAGCKGPRYCGKECQGQHWASGHKAECAALAVSAAAGPSK
ncbi:hypothetical protein GPECTOR_89g495 [Gonium pectorale]|uniref:MYND-type domain-containing protein n=1 Tax=Gonium pectorale TaxID=33097 RepID=A0A150G1V1_GONPE|nr:hypothetical protein GPECTOR_89g495 [Gonium pectorale]|eukprot:KXZ43475.1 hypothetical protein GPECTOR_89g495 [Gonium pectorale]